MVCQGGPEERRAANRARRADEGHHASRPDSQPFEGYGREALGVYIQLEEFHHGSFMDERKERDSIRLLGAECAKLQVTSGSFGEAAHSSLRPGLTEGTSSYAGGRRQLS
jgi:hypothetical protein